MKATGIVRRIDNLGRVVIPMEMRRTQRIQENDPFEIFTNNNGDVIFRKYFPMSVMEDTAASMASALAGVIGKKVIISDTEKVISGGPLNDKQLSNAYIEQMRQRQWYLYKDDSSLILQPVTNVELCLCASQPIIAAGDVCGAIAIIASNPLPVHDGAWMLLCAAAKFFQIELER